MMSREKVPTRRTDPPKGWWRMISWRLYGEPTSPTSPRPRNQFEVADLSGRSGCLPEGGP
jgi:hypothetical protein